MEQELVNYIKHIKGNILVVGIKEENVFKEINKNENINTCYLLQKKLFSNKAKVISIKKLKKLLDKNKINEIICNYYTDKDIFDIIPSKFYLNGKLYLYGYMTQYEIEEIKEKCSYYTSNIEDIKCTDGDLLIIGSRNKNDREKRAGLIEVIYSVISGIYVR